MAHYFELAIRFLENHRRSETSRGGGLSERPCEARVWGRSRIPTLTALRHLRRPRRSAQFCFGPTPRQSSNQNRRRPDPQKKPSEWVLVFDTRDDGRRDASAFDSAPSNCARASAWRSKGSFIDPDATTSSEQEVLKAEARARRWLPAVSGSRVRRASVLHSGLRGRGDRRWFQFALRPFAACPGREASSSRLPSQQEGRGQGRPFDGRRLHDASVRKRSRTKRSREAHLTSDGLHQLRGSQAAILPSGEDAARSIRTLAGSSST